MTMDLEIDPTKLCPRCGRVRPRDAETIAVGAVAIAELLERAARGDVSDMPKAVKFLAGVAAGHARAAACLAGTCEPIAAAKA